MSLVALQSSLVSSSSDFFLQANEVFFILYTFLLTTFDIVWHPVYCLHDCQADIISDRTWCSLFFTIFVIFLLFILLQFCTNSKDDCHSWCIDKVIPMNRWLKVSRTTFQLEKTCKEHLRQEVMFSWKMCFRRELFNGIWLRRELMPRTQVETSCRHFLSMKKEPDLKMRHVILVS